MDNKIKDMDIVTKMSIIGALLVLLIIIAIVAVSCSGSDSPGDENLPINNETGAAIAEVTQDPEYVRTIGVIHDVDSILKTIEAVDIVSNETIELQLNDTIAIKDAFGTAITLAQLDLGDMIDIKYDEHTMIPEYVNISGQIWERNNVDGLEIDVENQTVHLGNDSYNYTDDLVVVYEGEIIDITDIDEEDEVSIKYDSDSTVWSVIKQSGHGYLVLDNHEKFIDGILEIDKQTLEITYDTRVAVAVGEHTVTVSKDGYASFIANVIVFEGEEVVIDVGDMDAEVGMVDFVIEQEGVTIDIDGEAYTDFTKPITLDFGEYTLTATLDGYDPWESSLIVNQAYMTVGIDLEYMPQFIHVDSPEECELYIDANLVGVIPLETPIDPGLHTLTIRREGYNIRTENIEVLDNGEDVYYTFDDLIPINPEPEEEEETEDGEGEGDGDTTTDPDTTDPDTTDPGTTDPGTTDPGTEGETDGTGDTPTTDVYNEE